MGRSQIKYRSGRGRGQGSGWRGGGSDSAEVRGRRSGSRALGSNAFRYAEREVDGDEDEQETLADPDPGVDMRRQFFAGEQSYRDMGDVQESYFRTKAVRQWEADDDDEGAIEGGQNVGVMYFAWIAGQLAKVPLSVRYQIDRKYCVDREGGEQEKTEEELSAPEVVAPQSLSSHAGPLLESEDTGLDDLLALSSSVTPMASSSARATSSNLGSDTPSPVVQPTVSGGAEDLEGWLDDVLDM